MDRVFAWLGGFFGFTGVALGAFGAHGLRDQLLPAAMSTYQTAVLYQLVHAVAIVGLAAWSAKEGPAKPLVAAGLAFAAGIVFFSGSLYVLALDGPRAMGAVAPIGGAAFLLGWGSLFLYGVRRPSSDRRS
ncbi:MAG: DUF423 domain-containing protein [Fimbriimonadaceae bacterium]